MTRKWTTQDIGGLEGCTALITGASSGLGLHASHALAGAGARVLMACRNPGKGDKTHPHSHTHVVVQ